MKVALINSFWEYGSTGRNTVSKRNLLKNKGYSVITFYGMKKIKDTPDDVVFIGNKFSNFIHHCFAYFFGLAGFGSCILTLRLISKLKKFNPDIVWLYNIHGYYLNESMLINYLKKNKVWTVYDMADEYPFLGKCCSSFECNKFQEENGCHNCEHLQDYPRSRFFDNSHLKFMQKKKCYQGWDKVVFRSAKYVIDKAKTSTLLKNKEVAEIDTAIDLDDVFYPRDTKNLREELGIGCNSKVVLCCAPINDNLKGVKFFMESAKLCENDDIVFINVSYGGDKKICPPNYLAIDYVDNRNKMAEFYSLADAYVCPSVSDAQPNACIEAMGCGTPIIGFNISGVPFITNDSIGTFVNPKDSKALAEAIKNVKKKDYNTILKCRNYACNRYSKEIVNKVTENLFDEISERVKKDKEK